MYVLPMWVILGLWLRHSSFHSLPCGGFTNHSSSLGGLLSDGQINKSDSFRASRALLLGCAGLFPAVLDEALVSLNPKLNLRAHESGRTQKTRKQQLTLPARLERKLQEKNQTGSSLGW